MIGDDDFFMQNADYHYGATDAEKLYGRGYDDYNRNLWRDGILMKPPTLEEEKRSQKNKDGAALVFTIVGGGGFIVTLIFMLLIGDAVNHNYEGILFLGWIISLIVLFIIFVILYRENNRMIDEVYTDQTVSQKKQTYPERIDEKIGQNSKSKIVQKKHTNYNNEYNKKFNPKPGESYNDYLFRINSEQKVSHPKAKKESERLEREETFNDQDIKQNNNTKKWAIILSTLAICLIILIVAGGMINHNGEYTVTDELEYQSSARGVHLTIWNEEGYSEPYKKGHFIIVVMKDSNTWEAMEGCLVSVTLKNKETGKEYNIDATVGENSYAYIDTDELPLGEYEVYASYYGDENHYANYYTDIEIVT